jgi:hypothetical protein
VLNKSASNLNAQRNSQHPIFVNPVDQQIKMKSSFSLEGTTSTTPADKTADVFLDMQKLKNDASEVQFENNRRNQFH